MKRIPTKLTFAGRSLLVIAALAILCVVPTATTVKGDEDDQKKDVFYTTSFSFSTGQGELWAIEVSGKKITSTDIGPTKGGASASLALSPSTGTLFSMCGNLFGTQQLATIDPKTGLANLFGVGVPGLAVMALAFAPKWDSVCGWGL